LQREKTAEQCTIQAKKFCKDRFSREIKELVQQTMIHEKSIL